MARPLFGWRWHIASEGGPKSPVTRHVLLTLSLHMSLKADTSWPKLDTLARETGLGRSTVAKHLDLAEKAGWLSRSSVKVDGGKAWRRVSYGATLPDGLAKREDSRAWLGSPRGGPANDEGGPRGDEGGPPGGLHTFSMNSTKNTTKRESVSCSLFDAAWTAWREGGGRLQSSRAKTAERWRKALKELNVTPAELAARVSRYVAARPQEHLPDFAVALYGRDKGCQLTEHCLESLERANSNRRPGGGFYKAPTGGGNPGQSEDERQAMRAAKARAERERGDPAMVGDMTALLNKFNSRRPGAQTAPQSNGNGKKA